MMAERKGKTKRSEKRKEPANRTPAEVESARRFSNWLQEHGVSLHQFATDAGIGRTTVSALAGLSGQTAQTGWGGIRRTTLERIHRAVNEREPMTMREMGKKFAVDVDSRSDIWAEVQAFAGETIGAPELAAGLSLRITWDATSAVPPLVVMDPDGKHHITASVAPGHRLLGRLRSLSPVE